MEKQIKKILVAGASGHLGRFLLKSLKAKNYWVRALTLAPNDFEETSHDFDDLRIGNLTKPETLGGICENIDAVISCAGGSLDVKNIRNRATFMEVDYLGNKHLLSEALAKNVRKFVYISVFGAKNQRHLEYADAHVAFSDALKASKIDYTIIRPTGFFYVFGEIFEMAKSGRAIQIGDGSSRTNPIHEADLAEVCVDALLSPEKTIDVGGPEILSRYDTTALAFSALNKPPKITNVPPGLFKLAAGIIKPFNPRIYALLRFGAEVSTTEVVAPCYGTRKLADFYRELAAIKETDIHV